MPAAAARRLDDTYRGYLIERGAKPLALAEITSLVTGVGGLRLAGRRGPRSVEARGGSAPGDREAARHELLRASEAVKGWYDELAESLSPDSAAAAPSP